MAKQIVLTRIHKALGWAMLFLLPAQLFSGLWAMGRIGGQESLLAGAVHIGPWAVLALGVMIISHGLLGIRFTVARKLGGRAGAILLIAVWIAFVTALAIITL